MKKCRITVTVRNDSGRGERQVTGREAKAPSCVVLGLPRHLGLLDDAPGRGVPNDARRARGLFGGRVEGLLVRESRGRRRMRMKRKRKKGECEVMNIGINVRENCVGECVSHTETGIQPETQTAIDRN